eukprot:CAMPEP_0113601030 /NCGR_PEP_ID=MMETSP0017_2-20120614/18_1 /TAXON_ID=2856 /ORGANISM="Cylindrotheca closterium" /LENGTH=108 /DNA_ID=CAMNT_0000509309 /DNA_START=124 /DNA_END=450 /DNA_ORIENTATION=+ /assembly_acc=CAM_ASM_000147
MIVSKSLPQSLLLPMNLEEPPARESFPSTRFALQPRNESSCTGTTTPPEQTQVEPSTRSQACPVLVTPRCQNLNSRKRGRQDDESDSDSDEEELCMLNVPKRLLLSFD